MIAGQNAKRWIGVLLIGCLSLAYRLVILTNWAAIARMDADLEQAQQSLETAQAIALRAPILEKQFKELGQEIRYKYRDYVASADSPFPWASAMITRQATRAGLDISVLTPLSVRVAPWAELSADHSPFELFAVRLDVRAEYPQALALIRYIEEENPLLTLTSMSAIETGMDHGRYRVTMVWEWPMWKKSADVRELCALVDSAR